MFLKLRIIFTILSAICIATILPIGAFLDLTWALVVAIFAFAFFLAMMICKQEQEKREAAEKTPIQKDEPSNEQKSE